jgi:hypothetical protein
MTFDQKVYAGVILTLVMLSMFLGVLAYDKSRVLEFYKRDSDYYRKAYDYLSNGVIDRGYMEICVNKKGEEGVWFKDECI